MTTEPFRTPILILFWRRSTAVARLIERLRPLAPTRLFLACDGPRSNNSREAEQVEQTRKLIEEAIDWPCTVEKRYSNINQGCKHGPGNGINWFFSRVEEGIILEDDCLPELSFFSYCQSLLDRYRHDTRVWQISGNNFVEQFTTGPESYAFSGYTTTWGWATWRRCWNAYDIDMKAWPNVKESGLLRHAFEGEDELNYWTRIWDRLYTDHYPVAWDYQWNFLCFTNGGLSAIPKHNLVSNIGFGEGATHCLDTEDPRAELESSELTDLIHPEFVLRNWQLDRAIYESIYQDAAKRPAGPLRRMALEAFFTAKGIAHKLGS